MNVTGTQNYSSNTNNPNRNHPEVALVLGGISAVAFGALALYTRFYKPPIYTSEVVDRFLLQDDQDIPVGLNELSPQNRIELLHELQEIMRSKEEQRSCIKQVKATAPHIYMVTGLGFFSSLAVSIVGLVYTVKKHHKH